MTKYAKTLLVLLLALACLFAFAACSDSQQPADTTGGTAPTTVPITSGDDGGEGNHTHAYTAVVTLPTCTEQGYTTYTCECGDSYVDDFVSTVAHTYNSTVTEPTCSARGHTTYICDCGDTYVDDYTDIVDHCYIGGVCEMCGSRVASEGLEYSYQESYGGCYFVSGIGTCTDTDIVIPDTYQGYPVRGVSSYAFQNCTEMSSIALPSSIYKLCNYAFEGCTNLNAVYISDLSAWCNITFGESYNGTSMNPLTYAHNLYLRGKLVTDLTIPNDVTSINRIAFYGCTSLTSLTIPDGVTSIGEYAFNGCTNLASISLSGSITSIDNYAFNNCATSADVYIDDLEAWCRIDFASKYTSPLCNAGNLYLGGELVTDLVIPGGLSSLGEWTFDGCSSITSVTIPESVTKIEGGVFYNCTRLKEISIPNSVTSIGNSAFAGCTSLKSVTIPDSVTSIGARAFSGCTALESIVLPFVGDSIKTSSDKNQYPFGYIFGTSDYDDGTAVTQYYYGSNTTKATSTTYYIPSSLKNVTITGGDILYGAFYNCSMLTSVTIGDGVTDIGSYAFYYCNRLKSIAISSSVTGIGEYAFDGCYKLSGVYITDVAAWCGINFGNRDSNNPLYYAGSLYLNGELVINLVIPEGVTAVSVHAFCGCNLLISVTIPSSVTSISGAFANCDSIIEVCNKSSVTVSAGQNTMRYITDETDSALKSIGDFIFYDDGECAYLVKYMGNDTAITLPDYGTDYGIWSYAFYHCTELKEIIMPEYITTIGDYAFNGCNSLTSTTIPNSVVSIGNYAFSGCTGLSSITIPHSVTSIGKGAFNNCTGITHVSIGNGVTQIGYNAFYKCTSLSSVEFGNTSGWYRTSASSYTGGSNVTVTDPATAATYLTNTYYNYYWYRSE